MQRKSVSRTGPVLTVTPTFAEIECRLYRAAQSHAQRYRLSQEDEEDCLIQFLEIMLSEQPNTLSHHLQSSHGEAWLNFCAQNHVRDYYRQRARIRGREVVLPSQENEEGEEKEGGLISPQPPPHSHVVREEARSRRLMAANRLRPQSRDLFLRHFLQKETFVELAAATGRSPDAVRMVVQRAGKQVGAILRRQGMTDADADEYLAELSQTGSDWGG